MPGLYVFIDSDSVGEQELSHLKGTHVFVFSSKLQNTNVSAEGKKNNFKQNTLKSYFEIFEPNPKAIITTIVKTIRQSYDHDRDGSFYLISRQSAEFKIDSTQGRIFVWSLSSTLKLKIRENKHPLILKNQQPLSTKTLNMVMIELHKRKETISSVQDAIAGAVAAYKNDPISEIVKRHKARKSIEYLENNHCISFVKDSEIDISIENFAYLMRLSLSYWHHEGIEVKWEKGQAPVIVDSDPLS